MVVYISLIQYIFQQQFLAKFIKLSRKVCSRILTIVFMLSFALCCLSMSLKKALFFVYIQLACVSSSCVCVRAYLRKKSEQYDKRERKERK
jgi:hypothetical protein